MSVLIVIVALLVFFTVFFFILRPNQNQTLLRKNQAITYDFNQQKIIVEAKSLEESTDQFWWVSSGGYLIQKNGVGETIQGDLPLSDPRAKEEAKNNPDETDGGIHPQNIFRIVTKSTSENYTEQVSFKINRLNLSKSKNRDQTNGIHLFNRYQDQNNLYYTGIRADGYAAIKKKQNGQYYTLAYVPVWTGKYDRTKNPSLIPVGQWMGLRSTVKNTPQGVEIILYLDPHNDGHWQQIASALDNGKIGGSPLWDAGHDGIRTDFLDASFDNFIIQELPNNSR
ncbi:MAG TPA: hypothetical protein VFM02_02740 [Candidatus Paceibacterota bacterium]|nr:hypothetical protein [Candidatus Paceibacterota bacterium]